MTQLDDIINHAESVCKDRGSRLTTKRKQILSGLVLSKKALSAYELIDYCKQEFDITVPAMSMYRILEFLEAESLVHKLSLANKYVACSHITCQHDHGVPQFFICSNCNKVSEFSISQSTMAELQSCAQQAGYTLSSQQLEMNCLCNDCA
ncbi:Fur family transcriptional regulator [Vibrio gallicus]|uniref:Fur family transcriptional regulator n=1 Tax=Vibrio gallicus TaxID=190897 RepID=UPI0021C3726E|nr:transcriptional repressor [Vibrio gallicus]